MENTMVAFVLPHKLVSVSILTLCCAMQSPLDTATAVGHPVGINDSALLKFTVKATREAQTETSTY